MEVAAVLVIIAVLFIVKTVKVVPQQEAWVVERLGKFHASLAPGQTAAPGVFRIQAMAGNRLVLEKI